MKKNTMMRVASALLVAVLLTTCAISGTFAKYVTSATSEDQARVAYWGFQSTNAIDITGLFANSYSSANGETVKSEDGKDVIAPGTTNTVTFAFAYGETATANAPEVAYDFTVSVDGSYCDTAIANNANIIWYLDDVKQADWGTLLDSIKALSGEADGTARYMPGQLPAEFTKADDPHTIKWEWVFSTDDAADANDTAMGNAAVLDDVKIVITISATQVD